MPIKARAKKKKIVEGDEYHQVSVRLYRNRDGVQQAALVDFIAAHNNVSRSALLRGMTIDSIRDRYPETFSTFKSPAP